MQPFTSRYPKARMQDFAICDATFEHMSQPRSSQWIPMGKDTENTAHATGKPSLGRTPDSGADKSCMRHSVAGVSLGVLREHIASCGLATDGQELKMVETDDQPSPAFIA